MLFFSAFHLKTFYIVGCCLIRYRWVKDGKDFATIEDRIIQKSGSGTLTFSKPNEQDEGVYHCLAENDDGTAKSTSVVMKKAFLDNFQNDLVQTVEAQEGESLKLECKAPNGNPQPSIFWMLQTIHGAIKSVDNPRVTVDPSGNLWLSSVTRDDATKDSYFVCSAASSAVNEYKLGNRIMLKVIPRKMKSLNGSPPTQQFISPPDVFVLRGKKAEFFCIYDGSPKPKVEWFREGKPVGNNDERFFFENYGKSLKIKNVDAEDEGKYSCEVSSEIGETQMSSFNLKVEHPPHFTVEPQSKNVSVSGTFEIKCEAEGSPEPVIQWHFNGNLLEVSDDLRRDVSKTKIVTINAEKRDKGNYACTATNVHGYVTKDIYVNVHD